MPATWPTAASSTSGASRAAWRWSCPMPGWRPAARSSNRPAAPAAPGWPTSGCVSANLYGAPALTLQDFARYQQDTIVGATLFVTAPSGPVRPDRLINIGTNRWSFKPEVGVSKAIGPWDARGRGGRHLLYRQRRLRRQQRARAGAAVFAAGPCDLQLQPAPVGGARRHLLHRRAHQRERCQRRRPAAQFALGRHAGLFLRPAELAQDLLQFRRIARTGTTFQVVGLAWQDRWGAGL